MLYKLTSKQEYADGITGYLDSWLGQKRTPKGLSFFNQWGPNRYAANTAFLSLVAADYGLKPDEYRAFAMSQVGT
jgi:hypothetical protein